MAEENDTDVQLSKPKKMEVDTSNSMQLVEYEGDVYCLTAPIPQDSKLYHEQYDHGYKMFRVDELARQFKLVGYYARIFKLSVLDKPNFHATFRKKLQAFTELVKSVNNMLNRFQICCKTALQTMQAGVEFSEDRLFDDALDNYADIKTSLESMKKYSSQIQDMCSTEFEIFYELYDQTFQDTTKASTSVKEVYGHRSEVEVKRKGLREQMKELNEGKEKQTNKIRDIMEKIEKAKSQRDELKLKYKKTISETELWYENQVDNLKSKQSEEAIKGKESFKMAQNKNREKHEAMLNTTAQMFSKKVENAEEEFKNQSNANQREYGETMHKEKSEVESKIDKINDEYKLALEKNEHNYSNDVKLCEKVFDKACHDVNMQYEKSIEKNKLNFEEEIKKNRNEYDCKVKEVKAKFEERRRHSYFRRRHIDQEETELITSITGEKQQADNTSESKRKGKDKEASVVKEEKLKAAKEQKARSLQNAQERKKFQDSNATNVKNSKENTVHRDFEIAQEHAEKMKNEKESLIKQSYTQAIENAKREREQLLAVAKNTQVALDNKTEMEHRKFKEIQEEKIKKADEEQKSKIKEINASYEKNLREINKVIEDLNDEHNEHESALKIIEKERACCENEARELTKQVHSLIGNLLNEESIEYCLEQAAISIEYINTTIGSVGQFWKQIEDCCSDMEESAIHKRVTRLQNDQSNIKEKILSANGFKREIATLLSKWTTLNNICGIVSGNLALLQEDFSKFIIEAPSKKEAQDIIKDLKEKIKQILSSHT